MGLFAAGITMANDKNLNTYHKTLAVPFLVAVGTGLVIGTGRAIDDTGSIQAAMKGALKGVRTGSAVGAGFSVVATGIKGVMDVVETFKVRLGAN